MKTAIIQVGDFERYFEVIRMEERFKVLLHRMLKTQQHYHELAKEVVGTGKRIDQLLNQREKKWLNPELKKEIKKYAQKSVQMPKVKNWLKESDEE